MVESEKGLSASLLIYIQLTFPSLIEDNEINFCNNKSFNLKVKHSMNCISKNAIICDTCNCKKKTYIGQKKTHYVDV